jgi:hypothetical protein
MLTQDQKDQFIQLIKIGGGPSFAATELSPPATDKDIEAAFRADPDFFQRVMTMDNSRDDLLESMVRETAASSPNLALALLRHRASVRESRNKFTIERRKLRLHKMAVEARVREVDNQVSQWNSHVSLKSFTSEELKKFEDLHKSVTSGLILSADDAVEYARLIGKMNAGAKEVQYGSNGHYHNGYHEIESNGNLEENSNE